MFDAVLFDRDGTLVDDVPYNGDPDAVRPMPGARAALDRLRAAGLRLGVVTNQSGLARGRFTAEQMRARCTPGSRSCSGPFDTWQVCPHDDAAGCRCRKPRARADARGRRARRCGTTARPLRRRRRHRPDMVGGPAPPAPPASWCPPR